MPNKPGVIVVLPMTGLSVATEPKSWFLEEMFQSTLPRYLS